MTVSKIKVRLPTRFPSSVSVASPLLLDTTGGAFAFSFDTDAAVLTGPTGPTGSAGPTGAGYGGTSTTSLLIASSVTKFFTTQAGLAYQVGNYVRASSAASGANFMEGTVSAYSGTSLSIDVTTIGGAGTFADWAFAIAGVPGTTGVASLDGAVGVMTVSTGLDVVGQDLRVTTIPVANGGTGGVNLLGYLSGLQPLRRTDLNESTIGVNPGAWANNLGTQIYSSTDVLNADLATGSIDFTPTPAVGGQVSGALALTSATNGVESFLYLVHRVSDSKVALIGSSADTQSQTTTFTGAAGSPGIFTTPAPHGLRRYMTVFFTSGAPAPLANNVPYYVGTVPSTTTFSVGTTLSNAVGGTLQGIAGASSGGVSWGVQKELDYVQGVGVAQFDRRLPYFSFVWNFTKWTPSGIPNFVVPQGSTHVVLAAADTSSAYQALNNGTATSFTTIDLSPWLSNINRQVSLVASVNCPTTLGGAFLQTTSSGGAGMPMNQPAALTVPAVTAYHMQTDGSTTISYKVTGGAQLSVYVTGWDCTDPS